jgi:UrcA family protein
MSLRVPFDDLDLTTHDGARELRERVRSAARDVCVKLADEYPFKQQPGSTKCYEGALKTAMIHADAAIHDARY